MRRAFHRITRRRRSRNRKGKQREQDREAGASRGKTENKGDSGGRKEVKEKKNCRDKQFLWRRKYGVGKIKRRFVDLLTIT